MIAKNCKIGTRIKVVNGGSGAHGCNGMIGVVTLEKNESGILDTFNGINIELEGSRRVWRIRHDSLVQALESPVEDRYELIVDKTNRRVTIINRDGRAGVSKCNPIDEFDLGFGVELARARADGDKALASYLSASRYPTKKETDPKTKEDGQSDSFLKIGDVVKLIRERHYRRDDELGVIIELQEDMYVVEFATKNASDSSDSVYGFASDYNLILSKDSLEKVVESEEKTKPDRNIKKDFFKIGDRVQLTGSYYGRKIWEIGTVLELDTCALCVEFDEYQEKSHSLCGSCDDGHGLYVSRKLLEKIENPIPKDSKIETQKLIDSMTSLIEECAKNIEKIIH